jgi:hypothetical protein
LPIDQTTTQTDARHCNRRCPHLWQEKQQPSHRRYCKPWQLPWELQAASLVSGELKSVSNVVVEGRFENAVGYRCTAQAANE